MCRKSVRPHKPSAKAAAMASGEAVVRSSHALGSGGGGGRRPATQQVGAGERTGELLSAKDIDVRLWPGAAAAGWEVLRSETHLFAWSPGGKYSRLPFALASPRSLIAYPVLV